jgi:hypothetical protein
MGPLKFQLFVIQEKTIFIFKKLSAMYFIHTWGKRREFVIKTNETSFYCVVGVAVVLSACTDHNVYNASLLTASRTLLCRL